MRRIALEEKLSRPKENIRSQLKGYLVHGCIRSRATVDIDMQKMGRRGCLSTESSQRGTRNRALEPKRRYNTLLTRDAAGIGVVILIFQD